MKFGKMKVGYFCCEDWTVSRVLNAQEKFAARRTASASLSGRCRVETATAASREHC
ncbi:hypothetical protein HL667_02950 [Bradyrhizobium sp. 83012]|uniref:Uncharacterized protein n=1 Tax=Bradyrhizobium aeschynomenes TaxID=2734909 RepID=A0ABX2C6P9_9BRAD|nr:hypothetical protein [Bradyrhizobium aeschynomenes]NPU63948.1 hypothetical protein [Bradyrhizobium aeschynomenes]